MRLILAATVCFLGVGLAAPIITLKKFLFIENTFSVVLPVLKILLLDKLLRARDGDTDRLKKHLRWMHLYGKWSMLDVFVVAVLVAAVKLGAIASVDLRFGLYAFAIAVVLTMYVTARVVSLTGDAQASRAP
ncbi:MAG: paraquat-inducible protein [Proteobacteria bacterium]|nr:paraquat-inducible protein [Pseudomonadota bacterium]